MIHAKLTTRQIDLLSVLCAAPRDQWFRPVDLGAKSGSHHSMTLMRLVDRGFVEYRDVGVGGKRGAFEYRATSNGLAYFRLHFKKA